MKQFWADLKQLETIVHYRVEALDSAIAALQQMRRRIPSGLKEARDYARAECFALGCCLVQARTSFSDDPRIISELHWRSLVRAFPVRQHCSNVEKIAATNAPQAMKILANDATKHYTQVEFRARAQHPKLPCLLLGYFGSTVYVLATWGEAKGLDWQDIAALARCEPPRVTLVRFLLASGLATLFWVGVVSMAVIFSPASPSVSKLYGSISQLFESRPGLGADAYSRVFGIDPLLLGVFAIVSFATGAAALWLWNRSYNRRAVRHTARIVQERPELAQLLKTS